MQCWEGLVRGPRAGTGQSRDGGPGRSMAQALNQPQCPELGQGRAGMGAQAGAWPRLSTNHSALSPGLSRPSSVITDS